jgi:HD-GYP domain-containing protein (c-di-GMP phosphodiesterase class II)
MRLIRRRSKAAHLSDVLERISTLLSALRASPSREQILRSAVDLLRQTVPAESILLVGYSAENKNASILHASGAWSSLDGTVLEYGRTQESGDVSVRLHGAPLQSALERRAPSMSLWNTPLRSRNRILGSLWLGRTSDGPSAFSAQERRTAAMIADIAAGGLLQSVLDDRVARHQSQIHAMQSVERAITSSMDLMVTLNVFLDHATDQLAADAASILLLDAQSRDLTLAASRGFRMNNRPPSRIRTDHSLASQASLERKITSLEGTRTGDPALANQPLMREEGFTAYFAAPLIAHGSVKGVLEIFLRSPRAPDPEWTDLLEMLALQGAIAVDNSDSYQTLQRTNSELARTCDAAIEGWARAVDLRAREAEGHSLRVSELSVRTAEKMGMPPDQMLSLRRGALLHDIGKIGIPDRILWKPEALSEEEWRLMRQHPRMAEQLLAPAEFLRSALDIPKFHHERWDGSGYPYGLAGDDIPLAARVFSVIDVWDSMQSRRPFREPWSESDSIQYLRQASGRQFDPMVVNSFLQILNEPEF